MTWTKAEKEEIDGIKRNVQSLENAMRGNNGEVGLVAKVDGIIQKLTAHMKSEVVCPIHDVVIALYGDRHEGIKATGLIDAVAANTKFRNEFQNDFKKLKWLVITAIIGGFGNIVFGVLKMTLER
jgi:hypothetical protein